MITHHRRCDSCHRRVLVGFAAVLITACASDDGDLTETIVRVDAPSAATTPQAERAGAVDIGDGREIYLQCRGTGNPTVVLVSGFADGADVWSVPADPKDPQPTVFPEVATFSRVCAYDRPGTGPGRSTPVHQPTSAQDAAVDLDRLLTASGEVGPYVLVGHSYGSPIIRLYASEHPTQAAGLVLVDGLSEDLPAGLTSAQRALLEDLNSPPPAADVEALEFEATFQQLRESPPAPDVPVIVLTADRPQLTPEVLASGQLPAGVDQEFADDLWAAQLAAQDKLAAMFPGTEHITKTDSTHYIQNDNPRLVIDSIRKVVDTVRSSEPGS